MTAVTREYFAEQVLDALSHLYDCVYLQQHPLSQLLSVGSSYAARGHTLHRTLIEAIGHLKPSRDTPRLSLSWRKYQYFALRYLEGQSAFDAADALSISARQARRYHREMIDALVAQLWEAYRLASQQSGASESSPAESLEETDVAWHSLLHEELVRLGAASGSASASLSEALDSVIVGIDSLARTRGVTIAVELDRVFSPVALDRVLLRQVLLNILVHCIFRHGPGHIKLHAHTSPVALHIDFSVSSAKTTARDLEWKDSGQLEVVRELIASAQGHLKIGADRRECWLLQLTLPALRPINVLVVDDNPDIISLFRRYLTGRPYHVLAAHRAADALDAARRFRPDIIVLDVMMPDQDGWELLQMLRNLPENLDPRVLVCSVLREEELALALGATGFLAKPVTQQALLSALERCWAASPVPPAQP